jgi:excisionase family DNA binding protein
MTLTDAESSPAWATTSGQFWTHLREIVREELAALDTRAPDSLLTTEETAQLLQCSPRQIRRLRGEGLPFVLLGESPRFERDAVLLWLRAGVGQASER